MEKPPFNFVHHLLEGCNTAVAASEAILKQERSHPDATNELMLAAVGINSCCPDESLLPYTMSH